MGRSIGGRKLLRVTISTQKLACLRNQDKMGIAEILMAILRMMVELRSEPVSVKQGLPRVTFSFLVPRLRLSKAIVQILIIALKMSWSLLMEYAKIAKRNSFPPCLV